MDVLVYSSLRVIHDYFLKLNLQNELCDIVLAPTPGDPMNNIQCRVLNSPAQPFGFFYGVMFGLLLFLLPIFSPAFVSFLRNLAFSRCV